MLTIVALLLVLAAVAAGFVVLARAVPGIRDGLLTMVDTRLGAIDDRIDRRVGELLLGNLLRDSLPPDAFQLQYTFRSGDRVDAIVKVDKLVPVDAKFPLDNFERVAAAGDDTERELHERAFARDVKGHVDAIA